ncbi:RrF2 family transcriptional regulator [Gracilinema caldarium]|uniref:Transcriptional regulator, BadM/Rrf2 family n=1 Tax=Gracilinema caldarium (strain ATCC 51460 / DSM 7334 / H1) TaxID=744872 RepID=F8F0P9_GRAC1|nr:Rrf2 family transcriptional regulator [Gracilinema caldarium]AEJ19756.1 transcriptional regulator, BadM/Rrf2 family [Gracilinema caldarium DSM 7334]
MRITTRGRYALRATLALARLSMDGSPVSISRLSEKEQISSVFLEQIFFKLRKAGIVESIRGPGGGFKISQPLDQITIKNVLDAAGEGLVLSPCGNIKKSCSHLNDCISYAIWAEATELVNNFFSSMTLGSIIKKYSAQFDNNIASCKD